MKIICWYESRPHGWCYNFMGQVTCLFVSALTYSPNYVGKFYQIRRYEVAWAWHVQGPMVYCWIFMSHSRHSGWGKIRENANIVKFNKRVKLLHIINLSEWLGWQLTLCSEWQSFMTFGKKNLCIDRLKIAVWFRRLFASITTIQPLVYNFYKVPFDLIAVATQMPQ